MLQLLFNATDGSAAAANATPMHGGRACGFKLAYKLWPPVPCNSQCILPQAPLAVRSHGLIRSVGLHIRMMPVGSKADRDRLL